MAAPAPATTAMASADSFLDGRIDIVVKGAREIRADDIGGKSDAYCKIGLIDPGTKHGWLDKPTKSKTVTSLTPVWDLPFSFIVNCSKATELRVKVYDSDVGNDDVLGEVTIHPQTLRHDLAAGKKVKKAFNLTMPGDGGVSRRNYGYVDLELTYTPDPSPAAQQRKREAASKLNAQKEIALRKDAEKKGKKYIPQVDFSKFRTVRDLPRCFRAFIHNGNGLYLRVKPGKEGTVLAVASAIDDRQVWEITFIGDQHVQLKNLTMNKLMTAEKWVTTIGDVTCRCPLPGHTFERWEMFPIEAEPNNFSIRSFHDRFFSVTKEGVCRADAEKPGELTSLHFETPPIGAVALARAKFLASPKALLDEPWPWLAAVVLIIIVDLILRIF